MASTARRQTVRSCYPKQEFSRIADDFHNTLRKIGFDDKPEFAGACRFSLDLKSEDAAINVSALTPPVARGNWQFQIGIAKLRGKGRGGAVLNEWLFEAYTFDCVPEITAQAMYRILSEMGGSTLCPQCGGNGYIKTIWRPGDPSLDGDFKWCDACDRTGERRLP